MVSIGGGARARLAGNVFLGTMYEFGRGVRAKSHGGRADGIDGRLRKAMPRGKQVLA